MGPTQIATGKPTHVRWQILAMLTLIMAVTALGRLNLSIAGKYIQDEFGFGNHAMGWVLGAFAFGYAVFQVPCGWAGDRFGPRGTLTVAILWWAALTLLMGLVPVAHPGSWWNAAWIFGILRLLTGAGEAASYPNANKVVAFWTGAGERGFGSSLLFGGVGVGGIIAPLLFSRVVRDWGWRSTFLLCGSVAVAIAIAWYVYASNRPEEHPRVNSSELALITGFKAPRARVTGVKGRTPWKKLLSSGSVWGLLISYFCHGYSPYIFYTWFFIYLVRVRGLTVVKGGLWGSTPFIAITLMAPLGGWLSDRSVRAYGHRRGRRTVAMMGMSLSALLLWAGGGAANNTLAISMLAVSAGFSAFAGASWWAACIDLTPNHSGSLSGLMNTCANIAGGIAPVLTAYVATAFGWTRALELGALITMAGGLLWLLVDADQRLESELDSGSAPQSPQAGMTSLGPSAYPVK